MTSVFEAYLVPIIIALVIGVVIAWWAFGRKSDRGSITDARYPAETVDAPPPAAPVSHPRAETKPVPRRADGPEGNSIVDQGAAATTDVAGQILGVEVHGQLPGASGPPDNLQLLKGVGPKLATKLNDNGIIRFDQIARLSPNEVAILEDKLGPFKGRITRDRVVEQASYLARGDKDGFEAKFGSLG
jgi:predicted flap endonuclease-1-like 5' DNA nuclease